MKLVTILEADEGEKTGHVQLNDTDLIGTDAPGGNCRHHFSTQDDAIAPWKGDVKSSVQAFYPGAEIHDVASFNAKVEEILLAKGLRIRLASGLVTPQEKARLDEIAARAKDAAASTASLLVMAEEAAANAKQAYDAAQSAFEEAVKVRDASMEAEASRPAGADLSAEAEAAIAAVPSMLGKANAAQDELRNATATLNQVKEGAERAAASAAEALAAAT